MKKRKLRFFLDYGTCFWGADEDFDGGVWADDLPLSPTTRHELSQFLSEYDQNYDLGCPPFEGWTVADCKRFNDECKRIFNLVISELQNQFIICNEQFELTEDASLLAEFYRRGREFMIERKGNY